MQQNEILILLLGSAVLVFILLFYRQLKRLPASQWLFAAYAAAWLGWFATVFEHFFWSTAMNVLEHCSYAVNGLLLLIWCKLGMRAGEVSHGVEERWITQGSISGVDPSGSSDKSHWGAGHGQLGNGLDRQRNNET